MFCWHLDEAEYSSPKYRIGSVPLQSTSGVPYMGYMLVHLHSTTQATENNYRHTREYREGMHCKGTEPQVYVGRTTFDDI